MLAEILPMASEERLVTCIDGKKGNCADLTEWLPGFESVLFFPYLLVYEEPTHSSFVLADKKKSTNLPHLWQANIHNKEQNRWKYVNISKMCMDFLKSITSLNNSHGLNWNVTKEKWSSKYRNTLFSYLPPAPKLTTYWENRASSSSYCTRASSNCWSISNTKANSSF